MKKTPEGYTDAGMLMSNFDHEIDQESAALIKGNKHYGTYAAWNFFGYVWWEDGRWYCEILQYHKHVETISADTLEEIMAQACSEYGTE